MKTLTGGGGSKSSSSSSTGFSVLPEEMQKAWTQYATQLGDLFATPQTAAFTPIPQTQAETQAIESFSNLAPTAQSIKSDIAMQMNPYDEAVINEINRQATGAGSQFQKALNTAGQFGSNRAMLGMNDIDTQRLNQIGQFKQSQFNTALQNALTTLPSQRLQQGMAQMGGGEFQRALGLQTGQAPYSALAAYKNLVSAIPTTMTEGSSSSSQSSGGTGLLGTLAGVGSAMAGLGSGYTSLDKIMNPTKYITWNK